jgi:hypothetical protein
MDAVWHLLDSLSAYLGISSPLLGLILAGGLLLVGFFARNHLKGTVKFLLIAAALAGLGYFAYHVAEVGKEKKETLLEEPTLPSEMR